MKEIIAVTLGGGLGSLARFLMLGVVARVSAWPAFPLGTLVVNVLGCALAGTALAILERVFPESRELKLCIMTGILGGFTTFSSFGLEVHHLLQGGQGLLAILHVLASVVFGVLAVSGGYSLARVVLGV